MRIRWIALALMLVLGTAGGARAEYLDWSYAWSMVPPSITSINGLSGVVGATTFGPGTTAGHDAVILSTFSTGSDTVPDDVNILPSPYTLSVTLQDNDLGVAPVTLTFTGEMSGVVSPTTVNVKNKFDSMTDSVTMNGYIFTVTLTGFTSPTLGGNGTITAQISVREEDGQVTRTPEPSSLLLASLVVPAALWYRRRRARKEAAIA